MMRDHPAALRRFAVSASRALVRANFARHQAPLAFRLRAVLRAVVPEAASYSLNRDTQPREDDVDRPAKIRERAAVHEVPQAMTVKLAAQGLLGAGFATCLGLHPLSYRSGICEALQGRLLLGLDRGSIDLVSPKRARSSGPSSSLSARRAFIERAAEILARHAPFSRFVQSYARMNPAARLKVNAFYFEKLGQPPRIVVLGPWAYIHAPGVPLPHEAESLSAERRSQRHLGALHARIRLDGEANLRAIEKVAENMLGLRKRRSA